MKAVTASRYGEPDTLRITDAPDPKLAPDCVLVRVRAVSVNPVDWKVLAGHLDTLMNVHFPLIPGWDVSGVVEAVGLDATEFAVGDEVFGYVRKDEVEHGTFAELVSAPVRTLALKPASLTWEEAAAVPLVGLTAYQCFERVDVGPGDTVLIHAAAGGVGSFAVQIAVARGARVIGTASERNHDFLRSLGADPVSYGDGLADRVRAAAPEGVTAALDLIGGGAAQLSLDLVADPRRVVSIADSSVRERGGQHVWVRPSPQNLAALGRMIDDGQVAVHVERSLPLERVAEAFELSRTGRTRGKIVLTVA